MRQRIDETNHDMVNTLTQQICIIFNPLTQNTNQSYQQLETVTSIFDTSIKLQKCDKDHVIMIFVEK